MKLHIPVYPGASFSLADVERALPGARLTYDASSKDKLGGGCHIEEDRCTWATRPTRRRH